MASPLGDCGGWCCINLARLQASTIESNSNLDGVVKLLVSVVKIHKLR